jgi:predicted TIM-barrel fold metal-dependent hydrolase
MDKVIFGTDWTMCKIEEHIELVKSLGLDKDIENRVLWENSKKTYKLPL